MGMAWGCKFRQSAAGAFLHALVVLLYASLQPEPVDAACASPAPLNFTGDNIAIKQTRSDSDLEECPFQVWGVATVLLGGANSASQFYWFDCFHSSLGTMWLRVDPEGPVDNTNVSGGKRIRFASESSNHDLGLYACRASDGAMEYLNITDEVPGLIPVESSVEAFSGDTVTLSTYISTTNGLLTYVQWKDPSGDTVLEYPGPGEEVNAQPSHLVISDASLEESGTYNVTVQSREGLNFRGHVLIFLSVLVPSNITGPPPSELTVDEWEVTQLVCEARGSAPLAITWSRDGSMLPINSGIQTSSPYSNEDGTVTVTSTLTITESRYSDRGRYSCSAYNTLTTISHTDTAESTLNINPTIRIESEDLTSNVVLASFGTSLEIQCFGSGNLVWTTPTNQTVLTSYDPSRNVLTLSIPNFITPDRYTCSSDLVAGLEKTILITTNAVLSVFISDEEMFALRGSMVTIPAHIHSVDDVTSVIWYRNGTQLDPESDSRYTATVSDNALATLEIDSLRDEDIGIYVVVVTNSDDSVANASVEVKYPVLPSARVSPSQQTVEVGDSVDVVCATDGTGPLDMKWTAENGDVVADGNRLTIATATLVHSGVYTCTVSSPFSAAQATFDLTVLERLVALIEYDDVISPTHKVSFYHGDGNPPSFRCLVNGSFSDTSFTWQLSGGGSVPSGTAVDSSGRVLTWTHRLEYTDTGTYVCLVREPATERLSSATVNLTVLHDPVLDSIFPAPGITTGSSSITYDVPLGFTGPALTCTAFASPSPPDVKWSKNSGNLPRGIDTSTTVVGGIAISQLVFSSQFSVANVGTYKCEVRRTGEEGIVDSQLVELSQGDPSSTTPVGDCESVSEDTVLFQLRVATSSCLTWNQDRKSAITEEFQNFLFRLLSTQCDQEDCVTKETLTVVSLECSNVIEGGAVFRGTIETGSASKTEMVTCALSRWQRSRPLVTVEDNRFYVDSQCGLQIESYAEEECLEPESEGQMDMRMILMIAVSVGGVVLVIVVVGFILVCIFCCRRCRGENLKISDGTNPYEVNTLMSYRQTGDPTCPQTDASHRISVGSTSRQQDNPYYDDTGPFDDRYHRPPVSPVYDVALSPDRRPLFMVPPESLPREQETNFNDSGVSLSAVPGSGSPPHEPRQAHVKTAAQPYQIPTASTSSLNNVGVANPLWGVEQNPAPRGERRLSEGPSPSHHSPARLGGGAVSCVTIQDRGLSRPVGQLSTRDQTTGVSSSSEDYSHLDFSPPSKSVSCLGAAPQRKWYVSSEGSYASLGETEPTVRPYDAVRNSHVRSRSASSPQTKTPPTAPPQSHTPRGVQMMMSSRKAPPTSSAHSSVPSSLHMKQQLMLTETSLV